MFYKMKVLKFARWWMFGVSFIAMLWGYHVLFLHHAPDIFGDVQEDLSYGWYVPLFSLYVIWREKDSILKSIGDSTLLGMPLLLISLFIGLIGTHGIQVRFEMIGFIGSVLGLVWVYFGRKTAARVLFPLGFLLFCVPLHTFLDVITVHLRIFAVSVSYWILNGFGVEIVRNGTMLLGSNFSIDIAEPCSGMRSLFAMIALTAGYAYFTQPTWLRRGILFMASIPIAIFGNVMRILTIVMVAAGCDPEFATGFYHDYSGYIVFLTAISLMVAVGGLITKGAEQCDRR